MRIWVLVLLIAALVVPVASGEDAPSEPPPAEASEPEPEPEPPPVLPLRLHCGQLVELEPATSVAMVDMARMIEGGMLAPDPSVLPDTVQQPPPSGRIFAVAKVRLNPGQSVGRTDFVLRQGEETSECLALAEEIGSFDPRAHELTKGTVRLLFAVRTDAESLVFEYAPGLRVPLPRSRPIPFGAREPAAELPFPALEAEVSQPEPPSEPQAAAKPETKPAAKPEAKPEAKPAPKPPAAPGIPLF